MTTPIERTERAVRHRPQLAEFATDPVAVTAATSFALCAVVAIFDVRIGFNTLSIKDEGYLWYGAQRVLAGEWPVLDFRSYDPGRYLWSAAWQRFLGDGIVALRTAAWIFGAVGLTAGLLALRRVIRTIPGLVAAAVVLITWMVPRHKRFDCVLPMAAVLGAVRLIERRDPASHIVAGIVAGLIAFFGRNHGLYLAIGMTAIVWFIAPPERGAFRRGFAQLTAGALIGYLPMFLLWVVFPRYLPAFLALNADVVARGTNAHLPIPWPWLGGNPKSVVLGTLLVVAPLTYGITAVHLLRRRRSLHGPYDALRLATTAIGFPYLHHAFDRAEPLHFFQASAPFLLLIITYAVTAWHRRERRVVAIAVLGALVAVTLFLPLTRWELYRYVVSPESFRTATVGTDELMVNDRAVKTLRLFERVEEIAGGDAVLVTTNYPSAYAIMQKRAPVYDTYMFWKRTKRQQAEILRQLESNGARWALVMSERKLRRTNRLLYQHLNNNWERVAIEGLPVRGALFQDPS
ncbi:MAG: hypothetical protein GEU74_02860 [Nitriliruptorales bacterium]|nr:hypothetical protein [Nitriliruptorales bacterium]